MNQHVAIGEQDRVHQHVDGIGDRELTPFAQMDLEFVGSGALHRVLQNQPVAVGGLEE
ncbi:MAG TPA: hypothetical protein VFA03_12380 [Acetobacteraceae bacterium]|nr:hypothetical protein [Acetobacteraceae bacterium]